MTTETTTHTTVVDETTPTTYHGNGTVETRYGELNRRYQSAFMLFALMAGRR